MQAAYRRAQAASSDAGQRQIAETRVSERCEEGGGRQNVHARRIAYLTDWENTPNHAASSIARDPRCFHHAALQEISFAVAVLTQRSIRSYRSFSGQVLLLPSGPSHWFGRRAG